MKKLFFTFSGVLGLLFLHFILVFYLDSDKDFIYPKITLKKFLQNESYYSYKEINFSKLNSADTVLFGTSRIDIFPEKFNYKNGKVVNLFYGGESINRTINKAKFINKEFNNIKKYYFFLDLWAFNAFYDLDKVTGNRTKNLFTERSLRKVFKNLKNNNIEEKFPDLFISDDVKYPDKNRVNTIISTYLTDQFFPGFAPDNNFSFDNRKGLETIKEFNSLLAILKSNNKEVVIVFNPIQIELFYIIKELQLLKKHFDLQKFIYQYNNKWLDFKIYNFLILNTKSLKDINNNEYFRDPAHFSNQYAKEIIKIIFDQKSCLKECINNSENDLDEKNKKILSNLKEWEKNNLDKANKIDFDLVSTSESRGKILTGDGVGFNFLK